MNNKEREYLIEEVKKYKEQEESALERDREWIKGNVHVIENFLDKSG